MAILDNINEDFVKAFKEKNAIVKNALGNIRTQAGLLAKTKVLEDSDVFGLIKKELKTIQSTIDFEGIKAELKEQALQEKELLKKYLPETVSSDEVIKALKNALDSGEVEKDMKKAIDFVKGKFGSAIEDLSEISKFAKDYIFPKK